jgi:hypothetical protein
MLCAGSMSIGVSGHNFGHSAENTKLLEAGEFPASVDAEAFEWRALEDDVRTFARSNPGRRC